MKSQMFRVNHGTYPFDVLVYVAVSHKRICNYIERAGYTLSEEEKEKLWMTGCGRTVMLLGGQTILRLDIVKSKPDFYACLAHEVFHAVEFLFDRIGLKLSDDSGEAFAYQMQYLTRSILEKLK